ncbi:MAG: threonine synthase [Neomegalonema sp.]|nr:threonine synthase [Neomegalonema sp.]
MHYVSTRGTAPVLNFEETMLAGLARDGGLYVPQSWPVLSFETIASFAGKSYEQVAQAVIAPYLAETYDAATLERLIRDAYAHFEHPARAPLIQIGNNEWVMELHRGGTLAFKDFAMKLIGQMFEETLTRRGERVTIIGATSGDTGSAAIEAFRGLDAVDVFILFPHGRVSEVQRRQMTTPADANVHALAIEGSFDDCQALVKAMFNDHAFRDAQKLAAVNSINWARVLAQVVYYFTAAVSLGAPHRKVSFSVPTGNFGDIFAGWVAKQMGLPIDRLIIATNENDILHRCLSTGEYAVSGVKRTSAPSMDIQVSSNFERALFDAYGRDASAIRGLMESLKQSGAFTLSETALATLREDFDSARVSEDEVSHTIRDVHHAAHYLLDTHSAIGVHAARQRRASGELDPSVPMICLGCAHAAKFPDAVAAATGIRPALPPALADLLEREERMQVLPNDLAALQSHISGKTES